MARPELLVEVAFATGPGAFDYFTLNDPVRGVLGSNALASGALNGDSGIWVNLTDTSDGRQSLVFDVATHRGRQRQLEQYQTGTASMELENSDRQFDPTNLDGDYVLAGLSQVQPMKAVRIRAVHAGVTYYLFYGYADEWQISWSGPNTSTATLLVSDGFKVLANFDPLEVAAVGEGEDTGTRIGRILDNAGWPADQRDLDAGITTLQGTTLSQNALTEIKLSADTDLGSVYVAADGKVTFKNGLARQTEERSISPQAVYGDADDGVELPYTDLVISYNDELVRNKAQVARVGGTQQVAEDVASQAKYLTRTFNRTDLLMEDDVTAAAYAEHVINQFGDADLRFDAMTIEPDGDEDDPDYVDLWPEVLGREIGDRITIRRRPPGGGDVIERDCFIEGIAHRISELGRWITTFQLSDAPSYAYLILNDPVRGVLNENRLAYGGSLGTPADVGSGGYSGGYGGGY